MAATTLSMALVLAATSPAVNAQSTRPSPAGASINAPSRCGTRALPAHADSLDRVMARRMAELHVPGVSVAVVERGRVRSVRAYGWADLEHCVPATDSTLFGIGSISKHFTAVGALLLVQAGRLSLDDSITRWLPEGRGVWDVITVRRILTHTSGIPDYTGDDSKYPSMKLDRASSPTTPELLRRIAAAPLNFRPGDDWAYSNTAFIALSALIERVSGEPFPDYMREHVFRPVGMMRTRFYSPTELIPGRATPYHVDSAGVVTHGPFISDQFSRWGDMGMLSTARDMARWSVAMDSLRLLSPELWTQMWTPVHLNQGWSYPYGFALWVDQSGGQAYVGHGGTFRVGYTATFDRFTDHGFTLAMLSNWWGGGPGTTRLSREAGRVVFPRIVWPEWLPERPDPQANLTQSLLLLLQGADEAHGAIRTTAALRALQLSEFRHSTVTALRFVQCIATPATNPQALGTTVVRECQYHPVSSGERVIIFLLTDKQEVAGISWW